jgi:hypothetical protein
MRREAIASLVLVVAEWASGGEPPALRIGDAAPGFEVGAVVAGSAVGELPAGRVSVVAVFPTWSVRARGQLHRVCEVAKGSGAFVVGVCAREIPGEAEPLRVFVETMGEGICFPVHAAAEGKGFERAWLDAAGCDRLPVAFVVDGGGRVVAIEEWGSDEQAARMAEVVGRVVKGEWEVEEARRDREFARDAGRVSAELDGWREAMKGAELERVLAASDAVLAGHSGFEQIVPEVVRLWGVREGMGERVMAWAGGAARAHAWGHAAALNSVAWAILDEAEMKSRDYDLAFAAAERAVELSGEKDGLIMDTLALACFKKGDAKRAVELQRRAVELVGENETLGMRQRLATFEAAAK